MAELTDQILRKRGWGKAEGEADAHGESVCVVRSAVTIDAPRWSREAGVCGRPEASALNPMTLGFNFA